MVRSTSIVGGITLVHGITLIQIPDDGLSVAELRFAYRDVLSIGPEARAYAGGDDGGAVNVVYGAHNLNMPLAGFTVAEIQLSLRDVLNVGIAADAYVDGHLIEDKTIVVAGERIEFVKPFGRKGVGQTWTKEEFMQVFRMTEADWSDWAAKGLPFDVMKNGSIVLNETEVDRWKAAQQGQETGFETCTVVKRTTITANGGILRLKEAAEYTGTTVSGLRKLVDRKEIRYFQRKAHSPILFKSEWLDEYIEQHTHQPRKFEARPGRQPKPKPRSYAPTSVLGFIPDLYRR